MTHIQFIQRTQMLTRVDESQNRLKRIVRIYFLFFFSLSLFLCVGSQREYAEVRTKKEPMLASFTSTVKFQLVGRFKGLYIFLQLSR